MLHNLLFPRLEGGIDPSDDFLKGWRETYGGDPLEAMAARYAQRIVPYK